jgi:arginine/serine-rich splicing factor 16
MERVCNCVLAVTDEEGLQHVHQELEAKLTASFASNRFNFFLSIS